MLRSQSEVDLATQNPVFRFWVHCEFLVVFRQCGSLWAVGSLSGIGGGLWKVDERFVEASGWCLQ